MLRWLYKVWRCSITPAFNTALMCPVFLSGVCIVRVKTRRLILAGNDPASPLYIYTASCCFVSPVYPGFSHSSLTSGSPLGCKTVCVVVRALCQLPTRMSVKHSLSGDTGSYRRLHWGQTRQKIHSSLWWPLHVVFWRDMGLGGVWGEEASSEDSAPSLEDFGLKTPWQVNKAEAVILKLHNYYVCVLHRDWSHLCLQCLGLWSSCLPLHPIVVLSTISSIVEVVAGIRPAPSSPQYRYVKKGVSRFVSTLREMCEQCWAAFTQVKVKVCVCILSYVFVHICVCTCHCFKACVSHLSPTRGLQGGESVSALNKCYLWPLWQMLMQEPCTRKPTPSTWHKHTKRINPSSKSFLTLRGDGFSFAENEEHCLGYFKDLSMFALNSEFVNKQFHENMKKWGKRRDMRTSQSRGKYIMFSSQHRNIRGGNKRLWPLQSQGPGHMPPRLELTCSNHHMVVLLSCCQWCTRQ